MQNRYLLVFQLIVGLILALAGTYAQDHILKIWPDGAPGTIENADYLEGLATDKPNRILRVSEPTLSVYLPDPDINTGAGILICPGGGYRRLAMDHEGYEVAEWLNSIGIAGFVLKYRLPSDSIMVEKAIGPLQDAQEAMRLIRRHAGEWHVDPQKTGVMGFSAGGHLAATLSTRSGDPVYSPYDTVSARPDFAILVYPVISMDPAITHSGSRRRLLGDHPADSLIRLYSNEGQVSDTTPPTFIVHAADDRSVAPENSIQYFQALRKYGVDAELHIYQHGGHGFGLAGNGGTESAWTENCRVWLQNTGML